MKILSVERLLIAKVSWAMAPSMAKPRIRVGGMAHGNRSGDAYPQCTTGRMGQAWDPQGGCRICVVGTSDLLVCREQKVSIERVRVKKV